MAFKAWSESGNRGIASVVTGAGKTVFAQLCMYELAQKAGLTTTIIVPTKALVDQWFVSLTEDLGVLESEIAVYSGDGRPSAPRAVNLMVLNSARTAAPSVASTAGHSFLIVDECHRAGSPENAKALGGDHYATLGISATPEREHDSSFQDVLVPALGNVIYSYDYEDAQRDGVIAPFHLAYVKVPLTEYEKEEYSNASRRIAKLIGLQRSGQDVEEKLRRALLMRARVSKRASFRVPTAVRLIDDLRGERAVVFHEEIADADRIAKLLSEKGHRVAVYHTGIGPHVRRDNLRLFRGGYFDVLVTCRAIDEGVNIPDVRVAVIASATSSRRQRIQRLGRVLRPAPGKDSALVYTLYAVASEEARLAAEAQVLVGAESVRWLTASPEGFEGGEYVGENPL